MRPARHMRVRMILGLIAAVALAGAMPSAAAAGALAAQTSDAGGVRVKVTPGRLAPPAETWDFEVVFDTHTVVLAGDPVRFTVLVDARGRVHAPLRWDGDPPGGHHREGVLRFRPPEAQSGAIELRLSGVGGVPTLSFRWERR